MKTQSEKNSGESDLMYHREITLADERYMIFYTFAGELTVKRDAEKQELTQKTPDQKNV